MVYAPPFKLWWRCVKIEHNGWAQTVFKTRAHLMENVNLFKRQRIGSEEHKTYEIPKWYVCCQKIDSHKFTATFGYLSSMSSMSSMCVSLPIIPCMRSIQPICVKSIKMSAHKHFNVAPTEPYRKQNPFTNFPNEINIEEDELQHHPSGTIPKCCRKLMDTHLLCIYLNKI